MRVHLGCDHAGYELKHLLAEHLRNLGHDVVDHGAFEHDADDDYPAFCFAAAERVVAEPGSLGVVIGGSGNGEQIAANKVVGVRAALAWSPELAQLAREHNDANVVGIGARMHSTEEAFAIVRTFLDTPFSGEERHQRRIDQVAAYEAQR
ncbi:MAG TPA: ribose-5-phosphate isomerase [Candidatus Nanopelagicales bacterium]